VIEAIDGPTGVALAKDERPDVILLNVNLPGLAGWQVAKALVGGKEMRKIPIVLLTARVAIIDRVRGFDLGASN
jgi:DNA-binding response OmpR family regulator